MKVFHEVQEKRPGDPGFLNTWTRDPDDLKEQEAVRLCLDAAEWIWSAMEAQGVSRAELAKRLGVSDGRVSQILAGQHNMTLRTLARVAWALGERAQVRSEGRAKAAAGWAPEAREDSVPPGARAGLCRSSE